MKTSRIERIWVWVLTAVLALACSTPAFADNATGDQEPQLKAQEADYSYIEIYLNCPDEYGSPFTDDESYQIGLSTNSFEHETVRWSIYAGIWHEDSEATRISTNLTSIPANYLVPNEEGASVNVKEICDDFFTEIFDPCVVVGVELLKGDEVIASKEQTFKIQKPYQECNFTFTQSVHTTLLPGSSTSTNSEFQFIVFDGAHPTGDYEAYAHVVSAVSHDESIVTVSVNQEDNNCEVTATGLGTTAVTFTYESEKYPQYNGSFKCSFSVVNQKYQLDLRSATGTEYLLPGSDLDFFAIVENAKWNGEDSVYSNVLEEGDTIEYVLNDAPGGTTITQNTDPLGFTLHVPETAQKNESVYVTARILRNGEELISTYGNIATVRTSYYSPIRIIDVGTGEVLGDSIELEAGEKITIKPVVNLVTTEGTTEVTDLPWQVTGADRLLDVTVNGDGTFTITLLNSSDEGIALEVRYETDSDWDGVTLMIDSPQSRINLQDVAHIEGTDRIHLYDPAQPLNPGLLFRPQLNDGTWLGNGDYVVTSCVRNDETRTFEVTIEGYGIYCGQLSATIRTAPVTVKVADVPFTKDGGPNSSNTIYETVTALVDGGQVKLTRDTDYGVSYEGDLTIGAGKKLVIFGKGNYTGSISDAATYRVVGDITQATATIGQLTYTGRSLSPKATVTLPGGTGKYYFSNLELKAGTDYSISYKNSSGRATSSIKNAGTYTAVITGKGCYKGTKNVQFTVAKKANPLKVSGKTARVPFSKVKTGSQTVARKKAIAISRAGKGAVTYTKVKGNAKIAVSKKTGKITVKKGLKKGTYKVKVKVSAAGDANYSDAAKTITTTIVVW